MRCAIIALLLLPLAVPAVPTGLNLMPTADVLDAGVTRAEYEFNHSGKLYAAPDATVVGTQVGSFFAMEGGIDNVTDRGTLYNLKWRPIADGRRGLRAALGAQNLGSDGTPQYYAVATKPMGRARLSAGVITEPSGRDFTTLGMVGLALRGGPVIVKVDHVWNDRVDRSGVSIGLVYHTLAVSGAMYTADGASKEYAVTVSFVNRFGN